VKPVVELLDVHPGGNADRQQDRKAEDHIGYAGANGDGQPRADEMSTASEKLGAMLVSSGGVGLGRGGTGLRSPAMASAA